MRRFREEGDAPHGCHTPWVSPSASRQRSSAEGGTQPRVISAVIGEDGTWTFHVEGTVHDQMNDPYSDNDVLPADVDAVPGKTLVFSDGFESGDTSVLEHATP